MIENNLIEPDEDLKKLSQLLREPDELWEFVTAADNLSVFKRKDMKGTNVIIRCQGILPRIPKHVAFNAFSDMKYRKRWDLTMQNLKIVEDDEEKGTTIMYYQIKTPPFIQTRDALIQKKIMRDYPE